MPMRLIVASTPWVRLPQSPEQLLLHSSCPPPPTLSPRVDSLLLPPSASPFPSPKNRSVLAPIDCWIMVQLSMPSTDNSPLVAEDVAEEAPVDDLETPSTNHHLSI